MPNFAAAGRFAGAYFRKPVAGFGRQARKRDAEAREARPAGGNAHHLLQGVFRPVSEMWMMQ